MKLIQQDFKITSKIWFIIFSISALIFTDGLIDKTYDNNGKILFGLIGGILGLSLLIYNIYNFSFIYEFKQNEIVVKLLLGSFNNWEKYTTQLEKEKECKIENRDKEKIQNLEALIVK